MKKIIHDPSVAGQSLADRVMAAKHTITRDVLAKAVFKATTDEVLGPKRKHLDYLIWCTNVPDVSIPDMARYLIERTQSNSWVVVFKALVTTHDIMNYGNERFMQFLASNRSVFNLETFSDRANNLGYEMSTYVRRYSKYLNAKAHSYRQMGYDFCKVKRGKEDGFLRTIDNTKLLQALPILQIQLDALLEFNANAGELNNGVINVCYVALFKDLIRMFACYNDGVINLLEKFFDMDRQHGNEAIGIYKKFIGRMDKVKEFLRVAEGVGFDKKEIPDLAKVPDGLCEALEEHLRTLDHHKKSGGTATALPKPATGITLAISKYTAAAQRGVAPGAGTDGLSISEDERRRILAEEQKQLDKLKLDKESRSSTSRVTVSSQQLLSSPPPSTRAVTQMAFDSAFSSPQTASAPSTTSTSSPRFDPWAATSPVYAQVSADTLAKPPPGFANFGDILQPTKNETVPENGKTLTVRPSISTSTMWNQPVPVPMSPSMMTGQPSVMTPLSPSFAPMSMPVQQFYVPRPMFIAPQTMYPMGMGGQYWGQSGMIMTSGPTMGPWATPMGAPGLGPGLPPRPPQPQAVAPNDPFGPL